MVSSISADGCNKTLKQARDVGSKAKALSLSHHQFIATSFSTYVHATVRRARSVQTPKTCQVGLGVEYSSAQQSAPSTCTSVQTAIN